MSVIDDYPSTAAVTQLMCSDVEYVSYMVVVVIIPYISLVIFGGSVVSMW